MLYRYCRYAVDTDDTLYRYCIRCIDTLILYILIIRCIYCIHTCKAYQVYGRSRIYSLFTPYSNIICSLYTVFIHCYKLQQKHPVNKHKHMYAYLQIYWEYCLYTGYTRTYTAYSSYNIAQLYRHNYNYMQCSFFNNRYILFTFHSPTLYIFNSSPTCISLFNFTFKICFLCKWT